MPYPQFDRSQLKLKPLAERLHDMTLDYILDPAAPVPPVDDPSLPVLAERIDYGGYAPPEQKLRQEIPPPPGSARPG